MKTETAKGVMHLQAKEWLGLTAATRNEERGLGHRKKSYEKPIKKQRHHFADRGVYSQSYVFSSSHVWM